MSNKNCPPTSRRKTTISVNLDPRGLMKMRKKTLKIDWGRSYNGNLASSKLSLHSTNKLICNLYCSACKGRRMLENETFESVSYPCTEIYLRHVGIEWKFLYANEIREISTNPTLTQSNIPSSKHTQFFQSP